MPEQSIPSPPAAPPATGYMRLPQIVNMPAVKASTGKRRRRARPATVGVIPISPSTWWLDVKAGRYPKPVKLGPKITAWRVEDIRAVIEAMGRPQS